jgi:hypothetical protein
MALRTTQTAATAPAAASTAAKAKPSNIERNRMRSNVVVGLVAASPLMAHQSSRPKLTPGRNPKTRGPEIQMRIIHNISAEEMERNNG